MIKDLMVIKLSHAFDYDPFGMITVGRNWEAGSEYRFGFNGQEQDDEVYGNDNALDFGARIYDARLGRFLSIDPIYYEYPDLSPYCFAANNPIRFVDEFGKGPGDRVRVALQTVETYKKNGTKYSQAKREIGVTVSYSDCSAFVTTVLMESGYGGLFKSTHTGQGGGGGIQGEIQSISGSSSLKGAYTLAPTEGDIMMWGGHIAIVTKVTDTEVQFAAMGNSGANIGAIPLTNGSVNTSDQATADKLNQWGSGGFWGFWTPIGEEDPYMKLADLNLEKVAVMSDYMTKTHNNAQQYFNKEITLEEWTAKDAEAKLEYDTKYEEINTEIDKLEFPE